MNDPSRRAGERLRAHLAVDANDASRVAERARLVERVARAPRARPWLVPSLAAVLIFSVIVVMMRTRASASALTFSAGARAGRVGSYIAPMGDRALPLHFSDGSVITLEPASRARVAGTTPHGASLVLETGTAQVQVVHRATTRWSVVAGPYTVAVTGTSFFVTWIPSSSELEVQMHAGAVRVTGPGIESGVEVRGTQHFVTRTDARIDAPSVSTADQTAANASPGDTRASVPSAPSASSTSTGGIAVPRLRSQRRSWSSLARQGRYHEVLQAAEQRGIDRTLSSVSASDLAILADAARFSGRNDVAERALLAMRSRFPGTEHASSAAFLLGRLAEARGAPAAAVGWYDRYLAEAPGGGLVPEALGRRMVALKKAGDAAGSRRAAAEYLHRFPNGPYAGVARELVEP